MFNRFGNGDVIVDALGYDTTSTLQELSQRVADLTQHGQRGSTRPCWRASTPLETTTATSWLVMVGHGCLSVPPSGSLSVSGQTSYTADLTVLGRDVHGCGGGGSSTAGRDGRPRAFDRCIGPGMRPRRVERRLVTRAVGRCRSRLRW